MELFLAGLSGWDSEIRRKLMACPTQLRTGLHKAALAISGGLVALGRFDIMQLQNLGSTVTLPTAQ
jgi:hypothetical protein